MKGREGNVTDMKRVLVDKREWEYACYAAFEPAGTVGGLREIRKEGMGRLKQIWVCLLIQYLVVYGIVWQRLTLFALTQCICAQGPFSCLTAPIVLIVL